MKSKKGFTIIELLVVIAVIGILASMVLIGLGGARAKARDAKRLSDIQQVANGLELYFNAHNEYPQAADWNALKTTLEADNIGRVPSVDPSGVPYGYATDTNGTTYVLKAILEGKNPALTDDVDGTVLNVNCGDQANEDGSGEAGGGYFYCTTLL